MPDGHVTAVIPVWGAYADHRLDEAIASLREQDVPLEILLVDNADEPPLQRLGADAHPGRSVRRRVETAEQTNVVLGLCSGAPVRVGSTLARPAPPRRRSRAGGSAPL